MKLPLAPLVLVAAAIAGCGGSKTADIPSGAASTSASAPAPVTATTPAAAPGCRAVQKPKPKRDGRLSRPITPLDPAKTLTATVKTNCGTFAFSLEPRSAPHAAASIAYLAARHFFDGTVFHRIVPGFVIQGGDPTGSGNGGPGYSTHDRSKKSWTYRLGTVAMAKTGSEAAGTAGSQFFVVTGADAGLPPDYAVVGHVTSGLDVVKRIGKLGDQSQQPTATVEVESLRVTRG